MVTCAHPDRPVKARGLCGACYDRWWRVNRKPLGLHRQLHTGQLPDRIVAVLQVDGPLYAHGLAAHLDANAGSVKRALFRLRDRGQVESIPTVSVSANGGGPALLIWRSA